MSQNARHPFAKDIRRVADTLGGRVFVGFLLASIIFSFGLFVLRADKLFSLPASINGASAEDLVAFWRASQLALAGEATAAYDRLAFQASLTPPNDGLVWWNPPHAFLLIWPLSLAPYGVAKAIWIITSLAALAGIAKTARAPTLGLIAIILSPAAFASLLVLQSGPLIALGLLAALTMADRRPILCGLVLAILTVKPQYGLMAPVFLAAMGAWRAFGAAAAFTTLLAIISSVAFGVDVWRSFFSAPLGDYLAGGQHRDMVAIGHSLQKAGLGAELAMAAQIAVIAGCAMIVWIVAKRASRQSAIAITLLASAVAAPTVWVYDWPLVAAGLLMLATARTQWPVSAQIIAGLAWLGPLYSLGFATMASSLAAPLLLLGALVLGFWLVRASTHQTGQSAA